MLISIETHRTCDFLGGWGGGVGCGPPNPLWIHASSVGLGMLISIGTYRTCNFSVAISLFLIIEQNKLYKKKSNPHVQLGHFRPANEPPSAGDGSSAGR